MTPEEFDSKLHHYRASVVRIIDGDTVVLLVAQGFYARQEVHVRIADLNAPELNEPGGQEARLKLTTALGWLTVGWPLRVATRQVKAGGSETMSFARYVADIYVLDSKSNLVNVRDVL
jgi:endonuclease YncB( thermonuclease family)